MRERLSTQTPADRPQVATDPASVWRRAEAAMRSARVVIDEGGDAASTQAHLAAFGETLHNLALASHGSHRSELQAAARAFNRAQRSAVHADHQAANALRQAAKELAYASHEPGGLAVALIFTAIHLARAAARWHEQHGHQQQAAAAEQALLHRETSYRQASEPILVDLSRQAPRQQTIDRFEATVRKALPQHADQILADPAWPALATTLARAETAGHDTGQLLSEAAAERGLDTAESPAQVLVWRISSQPNKRRQAAMARSVQPQGKLGHVETAVAPRLDDGSHQRHRRR